MRRAVFALVLLAAVPALAKPPVWDRKIDSPKRFKVLKPFDSAAVLDQETGLVWEREPNAALGNFVFALEHCVLAEIGGRSGWRLPAIHELRTLAPAESNVLPEGHPFAAAGSVYWSLTDAAAFSTAAYVLDLDGDPVVLRTLDKASNEVRIWCVRGPADGP
jgi:Protein of unknown function (DUF1566)